MIRIRVTGGRSDHVRGQVIDENKTTFVGATVEFALVPEGQEPPAAASAEWKASSLTLVINPVWTVVGSYLVDETFDLGNYFLWAQVERDGTITVVQGRDDVIVLY